MSPRNVDDTLLALLDALDEAGLAHALVGGYAVVTWAIPRATFDVDVLVEAAPAKMAALFSACERRGFGVDEAFRAGWRDRVAGMELVKVQLFREGRAVTCDVFPVSTAFQRSAFARRCLVEVPGLGRNVPVISAADLVLFKLLADRPKDRLDVQNVIAVQGVPDPDYLREWARQLGVEARLERALAGGEG
jgi:hypothetical protein